MADNAMAAESGAIGPGARRAAAVLLGLGPEVAGAVFRHLGEDEVRRIARGARELRSAREPEAVPAALSSFVEAFERLGTDVAAGDELLREVAARALGPDVVRRAFDGVKPPPEPDEVLGPVAQADPEALAMVLAREQPQTVALVLSAIDPDRSAAVMEHLPEEMRPAILRRMATVESVAPEVLREVGQALSQELKALVAGGMRAVDGKAVALRILRQTPSTQQGEIVEEIEKDDPALAAELRSRLFTFDDILLIPDRDVQTLLRELDMSQLTVALRGATLEVKEKFLRNLSTRAAQLLADDLAAMGPVRLATVEAAQAEVVRTALELTRSGQITILRPADKVL
jgi:flagellar motor switch protein FliG